MKPTMPWLRRLLVILPWTCALAAAAAPLAVDNGRLRATFDPAAGVFSLAAPPSARPFVVDGRFGGEAVAAKVIAVEDKIFGAGQAIEVAYRDGDSGRLLLFPKLPFALFRFNLRNQTGAVRVVDRIRPLGFNLDLGAAPENLRVLGTGGLAAPAKAPGSYMWLAVAEPSSRKGVVAGWITSERGSGVVFPEARDGRVRVQPQIDNGKLRIEPGRAETLETFVVGYFDDARLGMEAWADAVASVYGIHLPPQPAGYCTWYHARASDEKKLAQQAAFAEQNLKQYGLSFLQIDDGWQDGVKTNGPMKNFTRARAGGPYPNGLKAAVDGLRARGFVPGLWFMPFAGNYQDPWFKDRQDWFAKRADGKPFDVRWGGTCLDMTHPEAREYLRGIVSRITKEWGFQYLKMDGLWMGSATEMEYVNDAYKDDQIGNAVLHDPAKTNVEVFRGGLKLIRETAGSGVFLLGCNGPQNMRSYGGAFGLLDAMRIGPDNNARWRSLLVGPKFGTRNYHLHGRVWYNDPDPLYVRASLPLNHARMISAWVTLSGQLSVSSDSFPDLPAERLDLLRRTMPAHGLQARPVDLFEREIPRIWLLSDQRRAPRRDVIGLFNWDTEDAVIDYPLERLGLASGVQYAAYEYWTGALRPPFRERLRATLAAPMKKGLPDAEAAVKLKNSSAVLAVRPVRSYPQLISTSRHITQGIVDVKEERWTAAARELAGASQVPAGDAYELRVLTYTPAGVWKAAGAEVSAEDRAAGVSVSLEEQPGLLRVKIRSAASRDVRWKIRFAPRLLPLPAPARATEIQAASDAQGVVTLTWKGGAPFYEVLRDGAPIAEASSARRIVDEDCKPGARCLYSVVPVGFNGRRGPGVERALAAK